MTGPEANIPQKGPKGSHDLLPTNLVIPTYLLSQASRITNLVLVINLFNSFLYSDTKIA
jgi:hypothetical protein